MTSSSPSGLNILILALSISWHCTYSMSRFHYLKHNDSKIFASGRDLSLMLNDQPYAFNFPPRNSFRHAQLTWPPDGHPILVSHIMIHPGTKLHSQVSLGSPGQLYSCQGLTTYKTICNRVGRQLLSILDGVGYEVFVAILNSATVTWKQPDIIRVCIPMKLSKNQAATPLAVASYSLIYITILIRFFLVTWSNVSFY